MLQIPARTIATQRSATEPDSSAWVEANAGSGKTYVLTSRVIRLLLAGVPAHGILCLTFTEAAAASMANKVFDRLRSWTVIDESELESALHTLLGRAPLAGERLTARRLFAQAIETPGGLKIQTIHGFAERLLHQFPLEAGIWPDFTVLDGAETHRLQDGAMASVLSRHAEGGETGALAHLQAHLSTSQITTLLKSIAADPAAFTAVIDAQGGRLKAEAALENLLIAGQVRELHEIDADVLAGQIIAKKDWQAIGEAMIEAGGVRLKERGALFLAAAKAEGTLAERTSYLRAFSTDSGQFVSQKTLGDKAFQEAHATWYQTLLAEHARLITLDAERHERVRFIVSAALYHLGADIILAFQRAKASRQALDFSDLILRAADLLRQSGAAWVHYKLDQGVDHILVDEAQDTSPAQWAIIDRLAGEFYAGESARARSRTLFAVGDKKQSIYRFQGVDPALFHAQKTGYQSRFKQAGQAFGALELTLSFRSLPKIMAAVETIFASGAPAHALGGGEPVPPHQALPAKKGGEIEIWPLLRTDKTSEATDYWQAPEDDGAGTKANVLLAQKIAGSIKARIGARERLARGEPLSPRDFLILVRTRGPLFEAVIQALKRAEVPLAGADRLVLTKHLAVRDLMALGQVMLMPGDDLALASVLKSPLFGMSEEALYQLANGRSGRLIEAIYARAKGDPALSAVQAKLRLWQSWARTLPPFDFYQRILGAEGGLKAIFARLSYEAEEALQVFLDQALGAEQQGLASLRLFLAELEHEAPEVKRNVDSGRDEVRVMTVHNAKGLEARVVILADTVKLPDERHVPKLLNYESETGPLMVWSPNSSEPLDAVLALRKKFKDAELAEYYRLLYVALTRAEAQIIIAGALPSNRNDAASGSWYDVCREALGGELAELARGDDVVQVWRPEAESSGETSEEADSHASSAPEAIALPAWATSPPKQAAPKERKLSPSRTSEQTEADGRRQEAAMHGTLLHRILEQWVKVPDAQKVEALPHGLRAMNLDAESIANLSSTLLALWQDDRFQWILARGGLTEVPIYGHLHDEQGAQIEVKGEIDRLIRRGDKLWLIDYKSGGVKNSGDYQRQLALYRLLLEQSGEKLSIQAALLWVEHQVLVPLSTEEYHQALADLALAHYI